MDCFFQEESKLLHMIDIRGCDKKEDTSFGSLPWYANDELL